jgi:hypothetical protein
MVGVVAHDGAAGDPRPHLEDLAELASESGRSDAGILADLASATRAAQALHFTVRKQLDNGHRSHRGT